MANIEEIGWVLSRFKESADPYEMRKHESTIEIKKELQDGLFGIEENTYIQIIFHFHESSGYTLIGPRYHGDEKGVFACRTPRRPGAVGLTTVKLLERKENVLRVKGLDAIDGTPVLDIKPYAPGLDSPAEEDEKEADREFLINRPRSRILPLIKNNDLEELLIQAGQFHGHYCVGVTLGVMAGTHAVRTLAKANGVPLYTLQGAEGMRDLSAAVEAKNCFIDGIQYVTGCTWGNGRLQLIERQQNRQQNRSEMAVLLFQSGKSSSDTYGLRVALEKDLPTVLKNMDPGFAELFKEFRDSSRKDERAFEREKEYREASKTMSFRLLQTPPEELFSEEQISKKQISKEQSPEGPFSGESTERLGP
jgi:tRNA-Thr(GGU) m(6)t(6)A37 methyltransferase TsaA